MTGKAENEVSITDYIRNYNRFVSKTAAENRSRRSPLNVTIPQMGSSPSSSTIGVTSDFLPVAGGSMVGPIALLGRQLLIDQFNNIDISTLGINTENNESTYTSNISFDLLNSQSSQLDTIIGAAFDGQMLVIKGGTPDGEPEALTISQFLNLTIESIIGNGGTLVTVTLPVGTGTGLVTGNKINISDTDSFDVVGAEITKLTLDSFTYQISAPASTTEEFAGVVLRGNIQTLDGRNIAVTASQSIQSWILIFDSGISNNTSQGIWRVISGTTADLGKLDNFGTLDGDFEIDFNTFREDILTGNINLANAEDPISITFKNATTFIRLHMRIYLLSENPALTIGGKVINGPPTDTKPWVVNDFLDIDLRFDIPPTADIEVVKKNNNINTGTGAVVPSVPQSVESTNEEKLSIGIIWDPPALGSLPLLYDLKWSLSPAGNTTDGPDTIFGQIDDIDDLQATATGLTVSTTFFFWLRATNTAGDGLYFGPLQTVTEPSDTAGDVNFSITETSFDTVQAQWTQPTGKALQFTLTRDPGGVNENLIISRNVPASGVTKIVTDGGINPLTTFLYRFQVFNETGSLLSTIDTNVTTEDLPQPVLALSAVGRTLQFIIDFPAGINICRVEFDIVNTFDQRVVDLQVVKTFAKGTPQQVTVQTQDLNQNTLFFVRAQFELNADDGPFNATQSVTTGVLPTPQQPDLDFINIVADSSDLLRFDINFADAQSISESGIITIRDAGVVTQYLDFGGNILSRDFPPSDDLDPTDEDEIQVVRGGGGWGAKGIITTGGSGNVTSIAITNGGADYVNGSRIRIFVRDDFNYDGFTGIANVVSGRLDTVSIVTEGTGYDNGDEVLLPGLPVSGDPAFSLWTSGQPITLRVVASNLTGTSTAFTNNSSIGT